MKILTRYVLAEVASHAAIGVALFTFVIFMRDVSRLLELVVRNSAPLPSVAQIFFLTLPSALTITLPIGVLVGILIGLSRLAADSEITAMRASGIGAVRFVGIIGIFAVAIWAFAMWNSAWLAPRSVAALDALQNSMKHSQASFEVQPRVFYEDFKNYVLYVEDTESAAGTAVWKNVFLADISAPGVPKVTLAEKAVVLNVDENTLRLHLVNGSQREAAANDPSQYSITTFKDSDLLIALPPSDNGQAQLTPIAEVPSRELVQKARAADPQLGRWYSIELHRRLAYPTACLVLALVGIPLGLSSKKGGKSTGFVLTIILVFVYYFALSSGVALARQGKVPPGVGVWLANIAFTIAGVYLLWRVERSGIEVFSVRALWTNFISRVKGTHDGEPVESTATGLRRLTTRFPQILDDYVMRQFIGYLVLITVAFTGVMLIVTFVDLANDMIRNHVHPMVMISYLVNVIPYFLDQLVPLCVLVAVLITFGLLQRSNEIVAMKATGISIYRSMTPILILAALIATGLFAFEQTYLPVANKRQDALRNQIKGKPPQTYLRADRRWIFGKNSTIYYYEAFDSERNEFGRLVVFQLDPKRMDITQQIYAARADWDSDLNKFVLKQGWERSFIGDIVSDYRTYDVATFSEITEDPSYFKKEVKQSQEMNFAELRKYIADLQQSGFDVVRLRVQLYKKIAFPVMTLIMAVLAVPFALSAGRRGALTGVAIAIGMAIGYVVFSGALEAMGNNHLLPAAMAAWFPNLIFGLTGGYLILKVQT